MGPARYDNRVLGERDGVPSVRAMLPRVPAGHSSRSVAGDDMNAEREHAYKLLCHREHEYGVLVRAIEKAYQVEGHSMLDAAWDRRRVVAASVEDARRQLAMLPYRSLEECARRYRRLMVCMKWASLLNTTEAAGAIRDYRTGHFDAGTEAVTNVGGCRRAVMYGIRARHTARADIDNYRDLIRHGRGIR